MILLRTLMIAGLAVLASSSTRAQSAPVQASESRAPSASAAPTAAVEAATQAPETKAADIAAQLFVNRCTGCHTLGRGNLTGPDLTVAITWREPDLATAVGRMQERAGALDPVQISALVAFLKDSAVRDRIRAEEERVARQFAAKLAPPSSQEGARLFRGQSLLVNGGMACAACHRIGDVAGGTLGPDLTGIFARMGETGLVSACEKTPFKVMSGVYRERPITRQEALHLTSWLQTMEGVAPAQRGDPVGIGAVGVAALGLVVVVLGAKRSHRPRTHDLLARKGRS